MSGETGKMDHDAPDSPESKLIGGPIRNNPDKVMKANPISYISSSDPPFLIMHGDQDPLVAHGQSVILFDALRDAGVTAELYTVKGAGHGGFRDPVADTKLRAFIGKYLRLED